MKHIQNIIAIIVLVLLMTCQSESEKSDKSVEVKTELKFKQKEILVLWDNCVKPDSSCTYFKVDFFRSTK